MGIMGKNRRSLFGHTQNRVAKAQEGSPSRSGGPGKDHKKRRFPSLFKSGRQSTASTPISQPTSTESNHSPAVSDQHVDENNGNDRTLDPSSPSFSARFKPSLAPFEESEPTISPFK